jgi:hypothetical protein
MTGSLFALEMSYLTIGALIVVVLMGVFLIPYLIKENRDGKKELGPMRRMHPGGSVTLGAPTPAGAGDNNPGRVGDPAPGQPDAQADPYGERAQRHAPKVHS